MKWTTDQEKVIHTRDCDLLVSAAAGSGKTAVLVERILRRVTDKAQPVNIDELLVVTFTNAAAAQMREKITAALYRQLEEYPADEHLIKQLAIIHRANITTIDSFCLQVVREHFQMLGLEPAFQIAEAAELKALCREVLEQVLEEAYASGEAAFLSFIDGYGGDKSDRQVETYIENIAEKASSYSDPFRWLKEAGEALKFNSFSDVMARPWYRHFMDFISSMLDAYILDAGFLRTVCSREPGLAGFEGTCCQDIELMQEVQALLQQGRFDAFCQAMEIRWPRAAAIKKDSVPYELSEQVKKGRKKYRDAISGLQSHFHTCEEQVLAELTNIRQHMEVLLDLTARYMKRVEERKLSEGMLDFSDVEHYAFRILVDENGPTAAAQSYRQQFKEIMIDEYQDSNFLQEDILSAISGAPSGVNNMFMVGDVKQSIYRFRMARPDLFMDKYNRYIPVESPVQEKFLARSESQGESLVQEKSWAQAESQGESLAQAESLAQRRIELRSNFRSRASVLETVNYMFYQLMGADFGGVEYDESVALVPGFSFPEPEGRTVSDATELMLLDLSSYEEEAEGVTASDEEQKETDKLEQEAHMVAQRILELVGIRGDAPLSVLAEDGESYRNASFGDIAILIRSVSSTASVFLRVLAEYGIPAVSELSAGLMDTQEIRTLLACLSVIHNPDIDIDLVTVLHSPMFGFTDEELARVRMAAKAHGDEHMQMSFYRALYQAEPTSSKSAAFFEMLKDWQEKSQYMDAVSLLWDILEKTKYLLYLQALDGGERRMANVYYLISCAKSFGAGGRYSLYEFLQYITKLKDAKLDLGEANVHGEHDDIVRIMSMHKSKGLEFPVVFVSCLGKQFNLMETRENVICHADDYLAAHYVDSGLRMRKKSFMHYAFAENTRTEDIAEEFRVLYVAMTRAKEKMILTGSCRNLTEDIDALGKLSQLADRRLPFGYRRRARSFLEWILMALIRNQQFYQAVTIDLPNAGSMHACTYQLAEHVIPADFRLNVQVYTKKELALAEVRRQTKKLIDLASYRAMQSQEADEQMLCALRERLNYRYPYAAVTDKKAKYSVSELKAAGGGHEREAYVRARQVSEGHKLSATVPAFMQPSRKLTGAGRGTLIHKIMQLLDFRMCTGEAAIKAQLIRWCEQGILPENTMEAVCISELAGFFASSLGQAMTDAQARECLHREKQFTILVPFSQVEETGEEAFLEQVLVQGIIDAYYEREDGSVVVVDYKTDQGELPVEQYTKQLVYYARALKKLTHKRVAAAYIYWFTKGEAIRVYGEE